MDRRLLQRELAAVALALLAAFLLGALAFQHVPEGRPCLEARGAFGPAGTWLRCGLVGAVGIPGAVLAAAAAVAQAAVLWGRGAARARGYRWVLAGALALAPVAVGLALGARPESHPATGLWGSLVSHYLHKAMGPVGAWFAVALAAAMAGLLARRRAPSPGNAAGGHPSADPSADAAGGDAPGRAEALPHGARGRASRGAAIPTAVPDGGVANGTTRAERLAPPPEEMPAIDPAMAGDVVRTVARAEASAAPSPGRRGKATRAVAPDDADLLPAHALDGEGPDAGAFAGDLLPPTTLLAAAAPRAGDAGRRELEAAGQRLLATLRTFKVDGELVGRTTGPTVTQFEIEPAAGVKVRQIAALADDLALAMRAPSIRIVAPIPGRGAVGVEVPNPVPEMVGLREVLDSRDFQQARAALPIALGKDLEGRPVVADLARMPHLLIAGATGSGKSVCVNTIITSLVYRHTPKTLRFLMVDPKMVELSVYNALPHLRHKVITDNRDAAKLLKWAVLEMQDRYRLLEANACRNLQEFNRRVQQHAAGEGPAPQAPRTPGVAFEDRRYTGGVLPYIVVVIDEMADLMMTVAAEVETPIAMLAQKARAIGIHLILATQRPSVNVITGLIKANFPCRIAFRVASQVDSRTIIDGAGAEALLGNGDLLFIPPGKSEPSRLQGAFLSSEETERLLGWFADARARAAAAGEPLGVESEPDVLAAVDAAEAGAEGDDEEPEGGGARDSRFREAAEVVIQHRQGSTSLLQRRMKIGYGRAARIIDQLEEAGVLAPSEGSARPRDVLVGAQDLDRICGTGAG